VGSCVRLCNRRANSTHDENLASFQLVVGTRGDDKTISGETTASPREICIATDVKFSTPFGKINLRKSNPANGLSTNRQLPLPKTRRCCRYECKISRHPLSVRFTLRKSNPANGLSTKPPVAAFENVLLLSAMSVKFIDTHLDLWRSAMRSRG
jgi:hypothetical protein